MTRQTEVEPEQAGTNPDENADWISKSQLKRDSKALQELGKRLCALNSEQLQRIPLDDALIDAIDLAHRISNKRGALKRHYQFIGKLLRGIDSDPIADALAELENAHNREVAHFRQLELWRDRILEEGDAAIQAFCEQAPSADRQQLRQIARKHHNAASDNDRTRLSRLLFKAIRDTS